MPFDGTHFPATPTVYYDTGLFPLWSRHGCRLWFQTRLRGKTPVRTIMLRAPVPAEHDLAVADLLRDAKEMIADPKDWTRRTYRSLGGQRCASAHCAPPPSGSTMRRSPGRRMRG